MSYYFYDTKKIINSYLYELMTKSRKREDQTKHLRNVLYMCHYYVIRLNPQKCTFYVVLGLLLGFIILKDEMVVDPFKVEVLIVHFPPPFNFHQLQSIQGKANFFCQSIANYAEIIKYFMFHT